MNADQFGAVVDGFSEGGCNGLHVVGVWRGNEGSWVAGCNGVHVGGRVRRNRVRVGGGGCNGMHVGRRVRRIGMRRGWRMKMVETGAHCGPSYMRASAPSLCAQSVLFRMWKSVWLRGL